MDDYQLHPQWTVDEIRAVIDRQVARCRKPHFDSTNYRGRAEIEAWNNGVDSLAREIAKAIQEQPNERNSADAF